MSKGVTNNDDIKKYIIKFIKDFFNDNKNDKNPKRNKKTRTISYKFDERNVYTIIYI
jgi:hypothetical protein